jgi:rubredoxin
MEGWPVGQALAMPREDPYELAVANDEYFCPVCGIGLAQSDFEKPEKDYYCPYCSTRQTPLALQQSLTSEKKPSIPWRREAPEDASR